jgi:kynurenine formamidase
MSPAVVELSHVITDGMPAYPGLPRPRVDLHLDHAGSCSRCAGQAEVAIGRMELVGNVGTYLDSPTTGSPTSPTSPSTGSSACRSSSSTAE